MPQNNITQIYTDIADAIRSKTGNFDLMSVYDFATQIDNIKVNQVSQSGMSFTSCTKINDSWQFRKITDATTWNGYDSDIAQSELNNEFVDVNLPHDWSIYNSFNSTSKSTYEGGYLDGGDAWYKKELVVEDDSNDNRYFLYFEGIYMESDVIVNGTKLCTHKNGYTNFIVEITDNITLNSSNEILVYVKNMQPSSRWYSGSGIYRDVYLIKSGKVGIKQQSIKITTPNLSEEYQKGYATTQIDLDIENVTSNTSTVILKNEIQYFGNHICDFSDSVEVSANSSIHFSKSIMIQNPKLWDEYDGQYYTLVTTVFNQDGEIISQSETYYGYRWFNFDKDTGFSLNGKSLKLRGACMHHDLGVLGAEANQSAIDRQLKILKEAGFNAIRLTHNPSCTLFTNACMRMGIMCVEEFFDCWTVKKKTYDYARFFMEYAEQDVKSVVKRSINNPSVIMWSVGNEIYDTRSAYASNVLQDPITTATNLRNWVRDLDTTRPVTIGENQKKDATSLLVEEVFDVQGFNYADSYYDSLRTSHPEWCLYGSETTSALSSRGCYSINGNTNYTGFDQTNYQCSSYDNDKVSWGFQAYQCINSLWRSYLAGIFVWTGFDYIGEPTPFNKYPCRSSYFGAVDIAGIPKDIYYLYQSSWTTKPMCHIVPMDWTSWTVGSEVKVMVYSNAASVELFMNGTSLGKLTNKSMSNSTSKGSFYMTTPFVKGRLVANAYDENNTLIAQDVVYTASNPNKISLESDKSYLGENDDLVFVTVSINDANDHVCPTAANIITATVTNGTLVGIDNGNATSIDYYRSNIKPVFNGKAVCVIKPNINGRNVIINVSSENLESAEVVIPRNVMGIYSTKDINFIDASEEYVFIDEVINCTGIDITSNEKTFNTIGDTLELAYSVTPENCTDAIIWTSSDSSVAIVNNGVITIVNNGTCTITATCGDFSDNYLVTVEGASIDCETITLSNTDLVINDTSQHDITATITPDSCTYEVSWTSSDSDILVIDNGGHYTAVSDGICTITATCGSKSAECNVTVQLGSGSKDLVSITATKSKKEYTVGDTLNTDDIVVTALYSDGTTSEVTGFSVDTTLVDMEQVNTYVISISYTENEINKTTTINILVSEPTGWDVEWNGSTNTLPERLVATNMNIVDGTDSAYVMQGVSSTSSLTITDSVSNNAELEIEIMTTDFTSGTGWKAGVALCTTSGYRCVVYNSTSTTDNSIVVKNLLDKEISIGNFVNNEWITIKIVALGNGYCDYYINGENVSNYAHRVDASTTISNIWLTSSAWNIKAIRYKKN